MYIEHESGGNLEDDELQGRHGRKKVYARVGQDTREMADPWQSLAGLAHFERALERRVVQNGPKLQRIKSSLCNGDETRE